VNEAATAPPPAVEQDPPPGKERVMRSYALTHLSDAALDHDVPRMASNEQAATAVFLAYLAEFDARRRYVPAGYASLFAYCLECLHLSDDSALKRIQAARTARRFPAIFEALADGRLHLSGVVLLAPHLTQGNAAELLRSAFHRTKAQIGELLAGRFPRTELLPLVPAVPVGRHAPGM
jgi:hypothetical protein